MRLYDAFETKLSAQRVANDLRKEVQYVNVRQITKIGRLKWGVFVGGKNSQMF